MIEKREGGAVKRRVRGWWFQMSNVVFMETSSLLWKIFYSEKTGCRRDGIEQPLFLFLCFLLCFASLFQMQNFHMEKYKLAFRMRCSPKPKNTVIATSYTATLSIMEYQQLSQEVDAH